MRREENDIRTERRRSIYTDEGKKKAEEASGYGKDKNNGNLVSITLSVLVILLSTILTGAIPNIWIRWMFIILFMVGMISCLMYADRHGKKQKKVSFVCMLAAAVILVFSVFAQEDGMRHFILRIADFFRMESGNQELEMIYEQELAEIHENLQKLTAKMDDIASYSDTIGEMDHNMGAFYENLDIYRFWESKENREEIDVILKVLYDKQSEFESEEYDWRTKERPVELMYKMFLADNEFCYYNYILALEEYGIDCEAFGITEYTLVQWDTEMLYCYLGMREGLEKELPENAFYDSWKAYYKDYKADGEDAGEYSDMFDYGTWNYFYDNKKVDAIMEELDKNIMKYYRKFQKNFTKNGG